MKITYVNNTDLPGRIFNGYDLMNSLNDMGYECSQLVLSKQSTNENVHEIISKREKYIMSLLTNIEQEISAVDLVYPYSHNIISSDKFKSADIIHYHLLHNRMISMCDLKRLLTIKRAVWTLHDPWIFTGHCVHPLKCEKWKSGCKNCEEQYHESFPLYSNTADQMWEIKRRQLRDIDIDIVVSTNFMLDFLKNSPITSHFTKIHKIPFGINLDKVKNYNKSEAKKTFGIPEDNVVIAVRDENSKIKGIKYFVEAMKKINPDKITILTVGSGKMTEDLKNDFHYIKLGWQNDLKMMDRFYSASDIFVMPSLAESFGLMAIEAMAHECCVICFNDTVLKEVAFADDCALAADYMSSESLSDKINYLIRRGDERKSRGKLGRKIVSKKYRYKDYVDKHIELYKNISE